MFKCRKRIWREGRGQKFDEYALLLALGSLGSVSALVVYGTSCQPELSSEGSAMAPTSTPAFGPVKVSSSKGGQVSIDKRSYEKLRVDDPMFDRLEFLRRSGSA